MLDADFLAAIGHPDRLRTLVLLEEEPADARALAERLELPVGAVEDHLRHLAGAGLIDAVDEAGDGSEGRRLRPRATGWADLAVLLAEVAGGASDPAG